jgi:hypothetical protein
MVTDVVVGAVAAEAGLDTATAEVVAGAGDDDVTVFVPQAAVVTTSRTAIPIPITRGLIDLLLRAFKIQ